MGRLMLLDTASLYFRAFFGVPMITAGDGTPVNAVRGMVDFVTRLASSYSPTTVVCCWDNDWRPAWRVELVPSYKAHRVVDAETEEVPDDLQVQVPIIAEVLGALGLSVIGVDGYEADDVIGTLVARSIAAGRGVDVVTGDRDLFQVVDDDASARVIYVARGVSKADVVDAAWVRAKYGIGPDQYADFATMRGDSSDGLPGVAGIGDKTAATLLQQYGDLTAIVSAATDEGSEMAAGPRRRLIAGLDYLAPAAQVVRVATDLPIDLESIPELPTSFDQDLLADLGERYNLSGPLKRLTTLLTTRLTPSDG